MKLQLFILCCVLQSVYGFSVSDYIIFPPDRSSSTRIIGGQDAPDSIAPYQCSLQLYGRHDCGCAVIADQYILTAAHCVLLQSAPNLQVLVGTNDLAKGGRYYKVANFTTHEHYDDPRFAYDIAVIKLQEKIEFNEKVQPIELQREEVPDGVEVQLTGWGRLRAYGTAPTWLQIIKLEAISTKRCIDEYHRENVHESHLCTWTRFGEGVCNGDSGGPLVYQNKVIGVVSFGVPCGMGYPDVYSSISYLYDWIVQHMN